MSSHANPDLFGKPGYQQPRSFRPLVRDDSLPHQIRLFAITQTGTSVSCVCLGRRQSGSRDGIAYGTFTVVREAVDALAWYRTHLTEVEGVLVMRGTVSDMSEEG